MEICPDGALPPLREVIRRHGLTAFKGLGQHFILDVNLTRRIARAAGDLTGRTVLEVGPGPGGLTRALLETPLARLLAVERDRRFLPALAELAAAYPGRLEVVEADALTIDEAALLPPGSVVVANLPYNVATPLLLKWLDRPGLFDRLVLMFQREVAERLVAPPGGKSYGRLAVQVRWLTEAKLLFDVPATAFVPPPKVRSSVVGLVPRPVPLAEAERDHLRTVLAAAFGQRRKMLRVALRQLTPEPETLLAAAGVTATARAEELDVAAFCRLARAYAPSRKALTTSSRPG